MSTTDPEKATERVVVLMTPKQKAEVTRRAKAARLSLSAFMCRQALGDEEILSFVVSELRESTTNAMAALDHALNSLAEAQASQPERDAQTRTKARAEFAQLGLTG